MSNINRDELAATATRVGRDALHVGVGAVVLAFQQLQVQRREIEKALQSRAGGGRESVESLTTNVRGTAEEQLRQLDERVTALETRIDGALDAVQERLPEQARDLLQQARDHAKSTRALLRERFVSAA